MSTLDAQAAASHLDDLEALEQVADLHPDPAGFEPWLRNLLRAQRAVDGSDQAVTLATVHRVKGQEWPVVVLVGVSDGLMPHRLATDVEEERRVLHVGLTRGIERVVVLVDEERPSPFVAELDPSTPVRPPSAAVAGPSARPTRAPVTAGGARPVAADVDEELLARLRSWRSDRARRDGVPAYVVLHDKHLQAIAAVRPTTAVALSRVEGMGPRRMELYADEILALTTG